MVFGNGVNNIQAAAYNGARTVCNMDKKDIICLILLIYHKFIFNETFLAISQY